MPRSPSALRYAVRPRGATCVKLDGVNSFLSTSTSATLSPANMTLMLWCNLAVLPIAAPTGFGFMNKRSTTGWNWQTLFSGGVQKIEWQCNTTAPTLTTTLPINQWLHLALTCVSGGTSGSGTSTVIQYLNGVSLGTFAGAIDPIANDAANLHIGSRQGDDFLAGLVADARIYNVALSAAQVQQVALSGSCGLEVANCVLWLPMGEGSGTTPADISGGGFTAAFGGGAAWSSSGPFPPRTVVV